MADQIDLHSRSDMINLVVNKHDDVFEHANFYY